MLGLTFKCSMRIILSVMLWEKIEMRWHISSCLVVLWPVEATLRF